MNKMMTLTACVLATSVAFAQQIVEKDEALEKAASEELVQKELEKPDGVCIRLSEDGSLQYIARGSASYNFGTAKDIRNKTTVAELDAKKRLVNFIEGSVLKASQRHEDLSSEQSSTSTDGKKLSIEAAKSDIEMCRKVVEEYTSGSLIGVVVLKTEKIPKEGSMTSGEIQVTIGMSAKTRAASDAAHKMIAESMNARKAHVKNVDKPNACGPKATTPDEPSVGASKLKNKPEVRVNDTLF